MCTLRKRGKLYSFLFKNTEAVNIDCVFTVLIHMCYEQDKKKTLSILTNLFYLCHIISLRTRCSTEKCTLLNVTIWSKRFVSCLKSTK